MKTLAERVKYARELKDLSQHEIAEKAGISQPTYFKIENGLTQKPRNILDIAQALNVNPQWLATGQGEMNANVANVSIANIGLQNINPNFEPVSDWNDDTPLEVDEFAIPFYKDFGVACGHGTDSTAHDDEKRRLRMSRATIERIGSHHDRIFATLADGDSMTPTINDGDTIWVDMSKESIKDGKIFVFEYGGLYMCKRLYRLPNNGLRVVSDNADVYPEWQMTGEEREQNGFRLIGWVWHWSVMERW